MLEEVATSEEVTSIHAVKPSNRHRSLFYAVVSVSRDVISRFYAVIRDVIEFYAVVKRDGRQFYAG